MTAPLAGSGEVALFCGNGQTGLFQGGLPGEAQYGTTLLSYDFIKYLEILKMGSLDACQRKNTDIR